MALKVETAASFLVKFLLGASCSLITTPDAAAQWGWGNNPRVADLQSVQTEPYVMVPVSGGIAAAYIVNSSIKIEALTAKGWPDPACPFFWGSNVDSELVGCSAGLDKIAFAYRWRQFTTQENRVVVLTRKKVANAWTYTVDPGFPVTVGEGFNLSITPNLDSTGNIQ